MPKKVQKLNTIHKDVEDQSSSLMSWVAKKTETHVVHESDNMFHSHESENVVNSSDNETLYHERDITIGTSYCSISNDTVENNDEKETHVTTTIPGENNTTIDTNIQEFFISDKYPNWEYTLNKLHEKYPNHFKVAQEYPKKKHDAKEKKYYFVSKRRYAAFNTYIEFEDYLNTLPEYERTFSEVKENNKPQKLFVDIDIKPSIDDGLLDTIVHIFIDTIILSFPEYTITPEHFVIIDGSYDYTIENVRECKSSVHIILNTDIHNAKMIKNSSC